MRKRFCVVDQTILADAQRICLIEACRLFFWVESINCFAARGIQGIVNECVRTVVGLLFCERAGAEHAIRITIFGIEVKNLRIRDQCFEIIGVFPLTVCAAVARREQVVGDLVLEKFRLRAAFHCPVIPLPMEVIKIDNGRGTELYAADFIRRRTGTRVIPRTDD